MGQQRQVEADRPYPGTNAPSLGTFEASPETALAVPRDTSSGTGYVVPMDGEDRTGRERKERLRARRDEAGMAQVSGWVPKDRRPYAREVLAALARGTNHLPPDPEQVAALDAAQADAAAARAAEVAARAELTKAEQRLQALATELDGACAENQVRQQAETAALARAEVAESEREATARELAEVRAEAEAAQGREQAAQEATKALQGELGEIRGRRGWRGVLLRFAGVSGDDRTYE
jgi:hypothetical protein